MFGDYSISKKLTWMNMLVSAAALVLACAAFIAYDSYNFRQGTIYNLSIQARVVGTNAISALVFDDRAAAEKTLSALQDSPSVVSAGILTPGGQTFATYARYSDRALPELPNIPAGQSEAHRFEHGNVVLVLPILFDGKPVGSIYIVSSLQRISDRLWLYGEISGIVLMVCLLAALLISPIFRRAVDEPIIQLAKLARVVSRDRDYSVRATPTGNRDELSVLIESFNHMLSQIQERDAAVQKAHAELEQRVEERTRELTLINKELESFSYSVSHDLRAPLRSIDGFSQALLEDYGDKLDSDGQDHLNRVRNAAQRMAALIDDMLNLSRLTRSPLRREDLDLSSMAVSIAHELHEAEPNRNVKFVIENDLSATGDSHLLRAAMENLLRNAWKYTSSHPCAVIEFGKSQQNGKSPFFVRDDGAGFDPRYSERLFGVFQRLHTAAEFPGSGVGLATVQRIIQRHGGQIWAEGAVEKGATFYFTLQ